MDLLIASTPSRRSALNPCGPADHLTARLSRHAHLRLGVLSFQTSPRHRNRPVMSPSPESLLVKNEEARFNEQVAALKKRWTVSP